MDTHGNVWLSEQWYATGGWGYDGDSDDKSSDSSDVANTDDDLMFRTARTAGRNRVSKYRAALRNGTYTVNLYFADMWSSRAGERVTDVVIEGVPVLTGFDAFAVAGPKTVISRTFSVTVQDGEMTLDFACNPAATSEGFISAIEIIPSTTGAPTITAPAIASLPVIALP